MKIFSFLLICLLFSCTMERRIYNKGYHIEWKHAGKPRALSDQKNEFTADNLALKAAGNEHFKAEEAMSQNEPDKYLSPLGSDHESAYSPPEEKEADAISVENSYSENDDTLIIEVANIKNYKEPTRERRTAHTIAWITVTVLLLALGAYILIPIFVFEPILGVLLLIPALLILLLITIVFATTQPQKVAKRQIEKYIKDAGYESEKKKPVEEKKTEQKKEEKDKIKEPIALGVIIGLILAGIIYIGLK